MKSCLCFDPTLRSDHAACSECGGMIESAMPHFNGLTPAELERLAILSEELGEAQQAVGKILRHGYRSHNPTVENGLDNRESLEFELGHVSAAVGLMIGAKDTTRYNIARHESEKAQTITRYLHHQPEAKR